MMLYKPEDGSALIRSGLTKLVVSCDGLTQQSYEKYRQGGNLEKVIAHTYCRRVIKRQKVIGRSFETMCHDCAGVFPEGARKYWS